MTNKSVMTFFLSIKYLSVCLLQPYSELVDSAMNVTGAEGTERLVVCVRGPVRRHKHALMLLMLVLLYLKEEKFVFFINHDSEQEGHASDWEGVRTSYSQHQERRDMNHTNTWILVVLLVDLASQPTSTEGHSSDWEGVRTSTLFVPFTTLRETWHEPHQDWSSMLQVWRESQHFFWLSSPQSCYLLKLWTSCGHRNTMCKK